MNSSHSCSLAGRHWKRVSHCSGNDHCPGYFPQLPLLTTRSPPHSHDIGYWECPQSHHWLSLLNLSKLELKPGLSCNQILSVLSKSILTTWMVCGRLLQSLGTSDNTDSSVCTLWAAQGLLLIRPAVKLINSFTQTSPTRPTLQHPESQKGVLPVYISLGIPRLLLDHHKPEDLHAEAEEDVKHNREQQWGWDELAWRPVGDQLWIGTCETHWNVHTCVYWCVKYKLCNTDSINDTFAVCNILNKTYKDCIKYKTELFSYKIILTQKRLTDVNWLSWGIFEK